MFLNETIRCLKERIRCLRNASEPVGRGHKCKSRGSKTPRRCRGGAGGGGARGRAKLARLLLGVLQASLLSSDTTNKREKVLEFRKSLAGKERHRQGPGLRGETLGLELFQIHRVGTMPPSPQGRTRRLCTQQARQSL